MSKLPKYVSFDPDRHGNDRWYYRRGGRRVRLDGQPGNEVFRRSYELHNMAYEAPERQSRVKASTFVYFLKFGNRRVKIGTCANVKARLQQLKTAIPGKPILYYVTPGGLQLEQELHQMFAPDRISGEWFQFSAPIRKWIQDDEARRQKARGVNVKSPTIVAPPSPISVALLVTESNADKSTSCG